MQQNIWKEFQSKIFGKMGKKQPLLIMLLVGVLLVVIAMPTKEKDSASKNIEKKESQYEQSSIDQVEEELEKILEKVEGVGKTEVMITYKNTTEKVALKDRGSNEKSKEETTVYENGTDGNQSPYIIMERMPQVEGIIVIAEGGDNSVVVKNITDAVSALFDVDTHKIKIMKGG